jgi:hypothetical protein
MLRCVPLCTVLTPGRLQCISTCCCRRKSDQHSDFSSTSNDHITVPACIRPASSNRSNSSSSSSSSKLLRMTPVVHKTKWAGQAAHTPAFSVKCTGLLGDTAGSVMTLNMDLNHVTLRYRYCTLYVFAMLHIHSAVFCM